MSIGASDLSALYSNKTHNNFGNLSIRQITGISFGSDLTPIMANIFLYYQNNWLSGTKKRFT